MTGPRVHFAIPYMYQYTKSFVIILSRVSLQSVALLILKRGEWSRIGATTLVSLSCTCAHTTPFRRVHAEPWNIMPKEKKPPPVVMAKEANKYLLYQEVRDL